ncbi:MAG: cation:proton antiporter [Candidatus Micrarchaeia archaeon]
MAELLSFLIVISAGLFLSEFLKKFHMPYVVALILAGIIIGPFALDLIIIDETIDFLGSIGLVFLMFMAGLKIKLSSFRKIVGSAAKFSLLNGIFPMAIGFLVASYLGYGLVGSFMLGIIFVSSSIAIVLPVLESQGLLQLKLGRLIVSGTILEDVFSLLMLSFFLQLVNPTTEIPLYLFYIIVGISLYALRKLLPKAREAFRKFHGEEKTLFEEEVRFVFVALIATVVFFDLLGMHPVIAGFFAGLVLSESIQSQILKRKLHAISYGLFIPVFFIIIGAEMDVGVLFNGGEGLSIILIIVAAAVLSKFLGGFLAGKVNGFNSKESIISGVATIPQLSTTLAVAFVGLEMGLIDDMLITAMIVLSIATTFCGPILVKLLLGPMTGREIPESQ